MIVESVLMTDPAVWSVMTNDGKKMTQAGHLIIYPGFEYDTSHLAFKHLYIHDRQLTEIHLNLELKDWYERRVLSRLTSKAKTEIMRLG